MDNLKVEYHKRPRHLINLISINVDKEILGSECHFSLQHLTDLRFLDPDNVIVGLKAKGKAKKDYSGFVVNN